MTYWISHPPVIRIISVRHKYEGIHQRFNFCIVDQRRSFCDFLYLQHCELSRISFTSNYCLVDWTICRNFSEASLSSSKCIFWPNQLLAGFMDRKQPALGYYHYTRLDKSLQENRYKPKTLQLTPSRHVLLSYDRLSFPSTLHQSLCA